MILADGSCREIKDIVEEASGQGTGREVDDGVYAEMRAGHHDLLGDGGDRTGEGGKGVEADGAHGSCSGSRPSPEGA